MNQILILRSARASSLARRAAALAVELASAMPIVMLVSGARDALAARAPTRHLAAAPMQARR